MNKKGILDKIITSFPVLLAVILVLAIYLFLTGIAFSIKGAKAPDNVNYDAGLSERVLFNEVMINGERMSVIHGLIKEAIYKNEEAEIRSKIGFEKNQEEADNLRKRLAEIVGFTGRVYDEIEKELEGENLEIYNGEERCFVLKQEPTGKMQMEIIAIKIVNGQSKKLESEISDAERAYEEAGLIKNLKFSAYSSLLGRELDFSVKSYYGRCYNSKELLDLKEEKNE